MKYTPVLFFGLFVAGVALWWTLSLRDITRHRADLVRADKQLAMYAILHEKAHDDPEHIRTRGQVDISLTIYHNVVQAYNQCLLKPQNRILARIMGYRTVTEDQDV